MGCFIDANPRALNSGYMAIPYDITENSIDVCRNFCVSKGATHFGIQYRDQCYCGDENFDVHGKAPELECSADCHGPPNQWYKCGAGWRNSVWRIDNFSTCLSQKVEVEINDSNHLGCFREIRTNRALPNSGGPLTSDDIIKECSARCQLDEYSHFGISFNRCWCGSDYDRHGRGFPSNCKSCDAAGPCGNNGFNDVFEILYPGVSAKNVEPKEISALNYVGCFQDSGVRAMLFAGNINVNYEGDIFTKCAEECSWIEATHIGLQYGNQCFCSKNGDYGRYGQLADESCGAKCRTAANRNDNCGGGMKNSVYEIIYNP